MKFDLLNNGADCEHTRLGFAVIFEIFAIQDAIFLGMKLFARLE